MTLNIAADHVPLALDEDGVARVGGSRIPLDTVVCAFMQGATPEQIAEQFPSLRLSDIYSVIATTSTTGKRSTSIWRSAQLGPKKSERKSRLSAIWAVFVSVCFDDQNEGHRLHAQVRRG